MGFEACPVLNCFCNILRKRSNKPFAIIILEHLSSIFGHDSRNFDIEHLARLKACLPVSSRGQLVTIDFYHLNFVRIINLCKGCTDVAFLAACFFARFAFRLLFLFGSLAGGLLLVALFKFKRFVSRVIIRIKTSNIDFVATDNCLSSRTRLCAFLIVASMSMFSIFIRFRSCVIYCSYYSTGFETDIFRPVIDAVAANKSRQGR